MTGVRSSYLLVAISKHIVRRLGLFFLILRHFAYVRVFPTYLKLVTPFFRVNISYKRIRKTTATEMRHLFPPRSLSGWMQDILAPLASLTAMVIEFNSFPVSPSVMRLFLSRFFFKDKTPHIVILVTEWMLFSAELESMRSNTDPTPTHPRKQSRDSILSRLAQK